MAGATHQKLQRFTHGPEIGAEIDRISDRQKTDCGEQQRAWIEISQVRRDALTGRAADACADLLDTCQQRQSERHGPGETQTELRACLAVGRNSARIIIGCACDQPGAQEPEE